MGTKTCICYQYNNLRLDFYVNKIERDQRRCRINLNFFGVERQYWISNSYFLFLSFGHVSYC